MNPTDVVEDNNYTEEPVEALTVPRYLISSYGADYDVEGLVKRLQRGDIFIPNFQRNYVWKPFQASQFIESILLGLPIPGIFLALDDDATEQNKRKMYVVDGLQRLTSLRAFLEGAFPDKKEFALVEVAKEFLGKKYVDLSDGDRRTINDYVLHATIIRQEKPDFDKSGIYFVFRRLNTNGSPLTPQEIRSALYQGEFDTLLDTLSDNKAWTKIYRSEVRTLRKYNQELILRFFALYYDQADYKKPMEEFLNKFMSKNKDLQLYDASSLEASFSATIQTIFEALGDKAFRLSRARSPFNNAIFDSVMVGVARRLEKGPILSKEELKDRYSSLIEDTSYVNFVTGPTTDEENVRSRIKKAAEAFSDVE